LLVRADRAGRRRGKRALEGLIAGGELAWAGYVCHTIAADLQDCAPSLDDYLSAVEAYLAFVRRTGNEQSAQLLDPCRWLAGVLRGESAAAAGDPIPIGQPADNPTALVYTHINRAIAAAVFGDARGLARHSAAAMPLLPAAQGIYPSAVARLLRGLALAGQARGGHGAGRAELLSELDEVMRWLAARAADAPANFLHLLRLLEAERAWAVGDFPAAALAFDAALRQVGQRQRPWHRALTTERAARFHLAHGLDHAGYALLAQARQCYLVWGATAKVAQLDWAYPTLRPQPDTTAGHGGHQPADLPHGRTTVTTGTLDLLGILAASQALSSETSIDRLHARVVEVLGALTGATGVHLLLWSDDRHDWLLPAPDSDEATVPVSGTGRERAVPLSVLRYAQRTGEPLVVDDATGDDRFARDPYFTDLDCCALLAVPILSRGALRAVLLLENRLIRGAFTADRLDAVKLIAGQLAVSLDNAQLYTDYRRIAEEQAALRRVATLVAQAAPPEEVFAAVAEEAGRLLGAHHSWMTRYDPDGAARAVATWSSTGAAVPAGTWLSPGGRNVYTLVFQTGRPARIDGSTDTSGPDCEVASELAVRAAVGVPVSTGGRLWGAMVVSSTQDEPLPPDTEARLAGFTELVATAIANVEAQAQLTASRARIVAAADAARRRIERDLHDGAQQRLVSLALRLRAAQAAAPPGAGALAARLDALVGEATGTLDELRELARGIHPVILAKGGLAAALEVLARRSAVPVELDVRIAGRLPEQLEIAAYYVVAEALTNAAKHAAASTVTVTVDTASAGDTDVLRLEVRDDGRGGAELASGTGLLGLKDRVEALGGTIMVDSLRGKGTTLRATLPTAGV
jgi:signal transduction histidine kinase